jgi:hypothetical protein
MLKMTMMFRGLHIAALGVAVIGFSVAVLGWLNTHGAVGATRGAELASLGGLLFGAGLGVVLLWRALRSTAVSTKTTMALYTGWIAVFAWYWFNRFAVNELHSLDPGKIAHEQVQQTAISVGIFLVWVGLYLIGPILTVRRLRH